VAIRLIDWLDGEHRIIRDPCAAPEDVERSVQMKICSPPSMLTVALTIGFAWITTSLQGATRFTVSGKIEAVTRNSQVTLFADKPFYGPPTPVGVFALWNVNKHTLFAATVPIAIPLTLDGKKARFADLKSGQYVVVEYELVVEELFIIYCAATRIDAHSAPPRPQSDKPAKHK
jgi:hypothetical protein